MAPDRPSGGWFSRLLPSTLRSRLTLTILLTNLVVVASAATILFAAWGTQQSSLVEQTAREALGEAQRHIDLKIAQSDSMTTVFAESLHFRALEADGETPSSDALAYAEQYAERMGAETAVWARSDATVLHQSGEPTDVASLRALLEYVGSEGAYGLIDLSGDRLASVSVRPIAGDTSTTSVGWYATATEIPLSEIRIKGDVFFSVEGSSAFSPTGFREIPSAHNGTVLAGTDNDTVLIRAEMLGIDGRPIGWLEIENRSSADGMFPDLMRLSLLVAGGIAIVSGLVVGLALTTAFHRPLDTLVRHIRHYGHAALEGQPLHPLERDPLLPNEFQNLLDVFDRLLVHLARRQTELSEAQKEASAVALTLSFAVNDSAEAKILIQGDEVVLVNPAASALLGVTAEHLLGHVDDAFQDIGLSTERGDALTLGAITDVAERRPMRVRITRPNESERWAEVRATVHEDESHTILLTGRDITEERRVESLRTEVVSLVSHDLRAPLTVISGYLDLLERPLDDDERTRIISAAHRSAERMDELLEDLLSATRAEELLAPSELKPVSMSVLAQEVVLSFEHTSPHDIHAHADCEGMVMGDEKRLRQVLVNLVTNAIKHAPHNSRIDVRVMRSREHALVLVEDQGPGIPEEDRELVFERFSRLEHGGLERPGVGLGLYIVRAIVEGHGGSVHVRGRGDASGACFVVELPAASML